MAALAVAAVLALGGCCSGTFEDPSSPIGERHVSVTPADIHGAFVEGRAQDLRPR